MRYSDLIPVSCLFSTLVFSGFALFNPTVRADSPANAPNDPWTQYLGCYQTLQMNGQAVALPPATQTHDITQILEGTANFFVDPATQKPVPAIVFSIYQGYAPGTENFSSADAFLDRGSFTSDGSGSHFQFSGVLGVPSFPTSATKTLNVRETIDLQFQPDGTLQMALSNLADGMTSALEQTFRLKPAPCPTN